MNFETNEESSVVTIIDIDSTNSNNSNDRQDTSLDMITCERCGHQVPAANMAIHQATGCGRHRHQHRRPNAQHSITQMTSAATSSAAASGVASYPPSYSNISSTTSQSSTIPQPFHEQPSSASSYSLRQRNRNSRNSNRNNNYFHIDNLENDDDDEDDDDYVDEDVHNLSGEEFDQIMAYSPPRSRARYNLSSPGEVENVNDHLREVVNLADSDDEEEDDNNENNSNENDNDDSIITEEWACPLCTLHNPIESRSCNACGYLRRSQNNSLIRRADEVRRERLLPMPTSNMHEYLSRRYHHNNSDSSDDDYDESNNLMRNVGGSALLGTAIGAFAGYTRNRNVLNSALEGAVAGAVGGAISSHIHNSFPPTSSSSSRSATRSTSSRETPSVSSSRRYLNVYETGPSGLGFTYRIGRNTGSSRVNRQIPLELLRMMAASEMSNNTNGSFNIRGENIDTMDYERLLEVFGDGSENRVRGASQSTIHNLPTTTIQDVEKELPKDCRQCAICLDEFENGQTRKTLECLHGFHDTCITRWLESNASCPICKFHVGGGGGDSGDGGH